MESIFSFEFVKTCDQIAAKAVVVEIIERYCSLDIFPTRNPISEYKTRFKELRKLIIDKYVVLYYIDEKDRTVHIYRVMNQKQVK